MVHTANRLAFHKDGKIHVFLFCVIFFIEYLFPGKIRLCKSWRNWRAPEIISISPLAVVSGKETLLNLKGRNLTFPGTK